MAGTAIAEFVRARGGRQGLAAMRRDAGAFDLEPGLALLPKDAPGAPALRRH
jgi:hypothetical protein